MFKLFKNLKPYIWMIAIIFVLTLGQVVAQLSLPDMMSKIINNGIYNDYETVTPYEVKKDDKGNVVFLTTGNAMLDTLQIPLPSSLPAKTITSEHEDYHFFVDEETKRLLPAYIDLTTGMPRNPMKLNEAGEPIYKADIPYILRSGGFMLLLTLATSLTAVIVALFSSRVAMRFGKTIRGQIFNKVETFSLKEYDKFGNASLITRSTNDVTQIQNVLLMMMRILLMAPMTFIGGLIMSINKSASMTMVLLITLPIILIVVGITMKFASPLFKSIQKKVDRLTLVLRENLTGIRVIRAFNKEDHESKRFDTANLDYTSTAVKANRIMAILMPAITLIMQLTTLSITWITATKVTESGVNVGNMMAVVQYVMQIMFSCIMVSMIFVFIPRASASAARINEVLDTDPTIRDKAKFAPESSLKGYIEFQNVSYAFSDSAEKNVVEHISFQASPGETTAIVGSTGSGKSTILNLIPRFFDPIEGKIIIDGMDTRDMPLEVLRNKIGFVPQKNILFSGTIAENIRYGKPDASDAEIYEALKSAQATEFIDGLCDGLNSSVSQSGNNFSGGQKQRLAIARALVRKPEIYIFDDSFSALDFKTDAKLREALKAVTKTSTVLIVAQRIGTILNADRIIVLDEGKIVGIGKHSDLLQSCGVYREIVSSQLSEEEIG